MENKDVKKDVKKGKQALRVIGRVGAGLAHGSLKIVDMLLLEKIPIPEIREDIRLMFKPIHETIDVLSDKDPNNLEQLKEVWENFVKGSEFTRHFEMRIKKAIKLMKDGKLKDFLGTVIPPTLETCQILISDLSNKEDAIKEIWIGFLSNKDQIKNLFGLVVNNESALEITADMIQNIVVAVDEFID